MCVQSYEMCALTLAWYIHVDNVCFTASLVQDSSVLACQQPYFYNVQCTLTLLSVLIICVSPCYFVCIKVITSLTSTVRPRMQLVISVGIFISKTPPFHPPYNTRSPAIHPIYSLTNSLSDASLFISVHYTILSSHRVINCFFYVKYSFYRQVQQLPNIV